MKEGHDLTCEAVAAEAGEATLTLLAGGIVLAGVGVAQIDFDVTQLLCGGACEANGTRAAVLVARVDGPEEHGVGSDDVSGVSKEENGGAELEVEAGFDDAEVVVERQNLREKRHMNVRTLA